MRGAHELNLVNCNAAQLVILRLDSLELQLLVLERVRRAVEAYDSDCTETIKKAMEYLQAYGMDHDWFVWLPGLEVENIRKLTSWHGALLDLESSATSVDADMVHSAADRARAFSLAPCAAHSSIEARVRSLLLQLPLVRKWKLC